MAKSIFSREVSLKLESLESEIDAFQLCRILSQRARDINAERKRRDAEGEIPEEELPNALVNAILELAEGRITLVPGESAESRMNQKRIIPEQTIQKTDEYQQKLMDRKRFFDLSEREEQQSVKQERQRKEQLKEHTQQEKQQRERRRFSDLPEKVMSPKVSACFPLPELDEDDIQLIGKWYKPPLSNLDRKFLIENHGEDRELGRLLSARSAEKIAMDFYQNQKYVREVEDISITQIKKNNDPDWEKWNKYDLNVDGCPIDVKNSRQSPKSEDRYTEHCIPRFKRIERTNQEVRIAGVFSPYLSVFELLDKPTEDHGNAEILFLGETTLENIQKLKDEFKDLVEAPSSNKYFLLPWIFDYPEYIYTEQDNARKELKKNSNFALLKEATSGSNLIPVAIAADIDLTKILDQEDLDCWEWDFFEQLRDRIKEHGLSLPFIFLTILDHFINTVASNKIVSAFKPENYRKFFFYEGNDSLEFLFYEYNNPLGLYDPLKTIHALIEVLSTLWTAEKGLIRRFDMFRLVSFDIFLGKSNDETSWTTLIAYCGGCGKNPLVLGKSKRCERRKLICPDPDCGYCCETCKRERSPIDSTHAAPTGGFKPADASETGGSDGYPPY